VREQQVALTVLQHDGRMGVFGAMDAWVSSAQAAMGLDILDSAAG